MTEIPAQAFSGRPVVDSRGMTLGKVDDVAIDPATWRVHGLVVSLDRNVARDMGVRSPALGVPRVELSPARVGAVGDTVILNVAADELAGLYHSGKGFTT